MTVTAVGHQRHAVRGSPTPSGIYVVQGLAPGAIVCEIELTGFRPLTRDGVRLATGETIRLDMQLEVGGLTEAVTVTADAPLLRSRNVRARTRHR